MAIDNDSGLPRRSDLPIALTVAVLYALATFFQEKFTVCNGFGHDGCGYGTWALDFPKHALEAKLGSYDIQRAFPSLVAWASLKALRISPTPATVVAAFQVMNVALIFMGALAWTKIARLLRIRATAMLFGTLAMFGTYGVVKFTTWYPVLGDLWGFAFGFFFLYAYLVGRAWLIAPGLLVGAFAWPSLLAPGFLLLLFGRRRGEPGAAPFKLHLVFAGAMALGWGALSLRIVRSGYSAPSFVPVDAMPQVARLSVLIAVAYCFLALRQLANFGALYRPLFYLRALATFEGALAIAVLVAVKFVQARWSVPQAMGFDMWFNTMTMLSTVKPGIFLLGYVVFFGPIVLVALLRWPDVVAQLQQRGAGLVAVAVVAALFGLDSEGRHGYTFVAIILPFVIKVLDDLDLERKAMAQLALVTALFSKLWLTLPPDVPGAAADFPAQTVFMSLGPWMSTTMYLVQLPIVVLVGVWLHGLMARRQTELAKEALPSAHARHVELGVARQEPIGALSRDAGELGGTKHIAAFGDQSL